MNHRVFIARRPLPRTRAIPGSGHAHWVLPLLFLVSGLSGAVQAGQLEPVVVEGRRVTELAPVHAGGQVAAGGGLGLLGNVDLGNAPFSQTSYTSALIEDQQATTLGDVLDNMPSVRRSVPPNNIGEQFKICLLYTSRCV